MRKSVLAAGAAGIASLTADLVSGQSFSDTKFVGFAGAVILLSLANGFDAIGGIIDVFAYMLVAAVVLNDGIGLIQAFGGI